MKHVIGFVGSPRKNGNTHLLVAKILEGAQAAGAATEIVFLNDLTIRECDGCLACWKGKPCPKQDDMNGLYQKIAASDAVATASADHATMPMTKIQTRAVPRWRIVARNSVYSCNSRGGVMISAAPCRCGAVISRYYRQTAPPG